MGYFILMPIALSLVVVGIATNKEKLYMLSCLFWFLLGFYCFEQLNGAFPLATWNGWLGVISFAISLYIMWDEFFGEFRNKTTTEETNEFGEPVEEKTKKKQASNSLNHKRLRNFGKTIHRF